MLPLNVLKKHKKAKIAFYFSGCIVSSYILKFLLKETNHLITVFVDQNKQKIDKENYLNEFESTLKIFSYLQKTYRDFNYNEIKLETNSIEYNNISNNNLEEKLKYIYSDIDNFDVFVILQDKDFFSHKIQSFDLFSIFSHKEKNKKIFIPFSNINKHDVIVEALSNGLNKIEINFSKIHNENIEILDLINKSSNDSNYKKIIDQLITENSKIDEIYWYLLIPFKPIKCKTWIDYYGEKISKKLHIYALSQLIKFQPFNEKLINQIIVYAKITDQELNQILINIVDYFAGFKIRTNQKKIDEVDFFFRYYETKITEETKDTLMWKSYGWVNWTNESLLKKLVELEADVGELLIRVVKTFSKKEIENKTKYLLDNYKTKIHHLQLNEALLKAHNRRLYDLCSIIINYGADKNILKFHRNSYAMNLAVKNAGQNFKFKRNYWRSKDRIIIKEILKKLGNPEKKIAPIFHVTGSNGKGSTCIFLKEILEHNGYKVNMFSSPSILRDNENYLLGGNEISDEKYYEVLNKSINALKDLENSKIFRDKISKANIKDKLTKKQIQEDLYLNWSIIVPAVYLAFSEAKADATIIEVITGGEFDLTNVFEGDETTATIINNIIFGDNHASTFKSIEGAAYTKSRLAKNKTPIISSDQENTVMDIIKQTSNELKSPLSIFKKDFHIKEESSHYFTFSGFAKEFKIRKPKLTGNFQINNVALAIAAILNSRVKYNISEIKVSNAIHGANSLGRLQEIDNKLIPPYKKVIFGSIKYAHSSVDIVKTEADYSIKIHDEALMFFNVLNYMKANETKIGTLAVSVNKNSKVLEKMLENLKINKNQKKYFSSKIKYLQKNIKKETLLILETTVQADREYYQNLAILKQIKQPHFELNFKFAKKNNLLSKEAINFIENII